MAKVMPEHEHQWRDTGFADLEDCECGAVRQMTDHIAASSEGPNSTPQGQ